MRIVLNFYKTIITRGRGLCERLLLKCKHCSTLLGYFDSSPSTECDNKLIYVNLRSVNSCLTLLRSICTNLDLPPHVTEKPYSKYIKFLEDKIKVDCERSMAGAASKFHVPKNGVSQDVIQIAVSVDGTWQKRHGFNSMHGVMFLISIEHGLVLDYVVKSLVCYE